MNIAQIETKESPSSSFLALCNFYRKLVNNNYFENNYHKTKKLITILDKHFKVSGPAYEHPDNGSEVNRVIYQFKTRPEYEDIKKQYWGDARIIGSESNKYIWIMTYPTLDLIFDSFLPINQNIIHSDYDFNVYKSRVGKFYDKNIEFHYFLRDIIKNHII